MSVPQMPTRCTRTRASAAAGLFGPSMSMRSNCLGAFREIAFIAASSQESGRKGRRVHDADPLATQVRNQVGKHRVLQCVMIVGQNDVEFSAVKDVTKDLHRIAADANESDFPLLSKLAQSRECLFDDLS